MDQRIKELIAVGASVAANCQPCLTCHVSKARENGADERTISTAIGVGKAVRKGAAAKMDEFAKPVVASPAVATSGTDRECGCAGA